MSNKKHPNFTIRGNLADAAELRYIPARKEGEQPRPVLQFRVVVNPTRDALKATGFNCSLFGKRAEQFKDQLVKGTHVEIDGDFVVNEYNDKATGEKRYSLDVEVIYGNIVTFDESKTPTKVKLAAASSAEDEQS